LAAGPKTIPLDEIVPPSYLIREAEGQRYQQRSESRRIAAISAEPGIRPRAEPS